jgi:predicted amidophosphoribosyltransferase
MMATLPRALERFLLPNACVACERPIGEWRPDDLLCGVCRTRLRFVRGGCARCAQPLPPIGPCRFCADWPAVLHDIRSAVWLEEVARAVTHHLKYERLPRLGNEMAALMARNAPRPPSGLLVPIPLARRRQRARGYNQALAIARALASYWHLPVAMRVLSRARETATQTALTPEGRATNVAGAFVATAPPGLIMGSGRSPDGDARKGSATPVILVDDVLTTGATLVAAASALGAAGWPTVMAVTFARALPYELRATG